MDPVTVPAPAAPTVDVPAAPEPAAPEPAAESTMARAERLGLIDAPAEPAEPAEPAATPEPEPTEPPALDPAEYWRHITDAQRTIREQAGELKRLQAIEVEKAELDKLAAGDKTALARRYGIGLDHVLSDIAGTPAEPAPGDATAAPATGELAELRDMVKSQAEEIASLKTTYTQDKTATLEDGQKAIVRGLAEASGAKFVLARGAERAVLVEATKLIGELNLAPEVVQQNRDAIYREVIKVMNENIRDELAVESRRLAELLGDPSQTPASATATASPQAAAPQAPTLGSQVPIPAKPKDDEDWTDEDIFAELRRRRAERLKQERA